jgi:hypothetical protein
MLPPTTQHNFVVNNKDINNTAKQQGTERSLKYKVLAFKEQVPFRSTIMIENTFWRKQLCSHILDVKSHTERNYL